MALVEHHDAPEDLHHVHARLIAEALGHLEAIRGALAADLHLDQLVVEQRARHLPHHRLGDALLADLHDGAQRVRQSAQAAAQLARGHEGLLLGVGGGHDGHRG
jgi:hypothetical protein